MSDVALNWHLRQPSSGWARRLDVEAAKVTRYGRLPASVRHGLAILAVLTILLAFCRRREKARASVARAEPLPLAQRRWVQAARQGVGRHLRRLSFYVLGSIALTTAIASGLMALPKPAPLPPAAPPPARREIVKPVRIWSLESPDLAGAPLDYRARVHRVGGGREDVMTLGRFDGDASALRLRLFRHAKERPVAVPLPEAIGREASELGLTLVRSGAPATVETRYGRLMIANVRLRRTPADTGMVCAGFRFARDRPALSVTGLACGRRGAKMSRSAVACLFERLDVASARDDRELLDFVAASELKRNAGCTGARLRPDTVHAPWLDDKADVQAAAFVSERGKFATAPGALRRR